MPQEELDRCKCPKPKKRKKPSDRFECFRYTVRQLRKGQRIYNRTPIDCE